MAAHGVGIVCVHKRVLAASLVEDLARARFHVGRREGEDMLVAFIRRAMGIVNAECEAREPQRRMKKP